MSFKHHTATALGPVKLPKPNRQRAQAQARAHAHTHPVCLLMLSTAFCSLFFPGMQNADETSQPLVHSLRRNCHSNPNICMNTKTHTVQWRMREREGGRKGERCRGREDWERMSSKVAKKASVPLSFCIFDWTKGYKHMNTSFLPLYFPSGYLFWKAAMHNKGSVLCLLVGWGANTPQLIMCLSVAVWAAAKGIRSSICECCSPHSRMPCHASQISSFFFLKRGKKHTF